MENKLPNNYCSIKFRGKSFFTQTGFAPEVFLVVDLKSAIRFSISLQLKELQTFLCEKRPILTKKGII